MQRLVIIGVGMFYGDVSEPKNKKLRQKMLFLLYSEQLFMTIPIKD